MKKMVLGLVLALAALGLIASPAMAAPDSPVAQGRNAADQTFLATLAAPGQAPVLAATDPMTGKSACTATATCGSGLTISCAGNSSCSAADQNCATGQPGFVRCDGRTFVCPPCA